LVSSPFNSTRYIRNPCQPEAPWMALRPFNSTRYIRNNYADIGFFMDTVLSTPHGTLGTVIKSSKNSIVRCSFNSTRYIRNS